MLEHIRPEHVPMANRSLLIPNPEWFNEDDRKVLSLIDGVLVKTEHAIPLFRALGCQVKKIGFTSVDRFDSSVQRERAFFHLAGRSTAKRTALLLEVWAKHPEWPRLTVVQNPRTAQPYIEAANIDLRVGYFDDSELKRLQNAHLFHLCPSETEGFGHYLMEALSVGAITLTTDAPPMNELVTPERGLLIPYQQTRPKNLAHRYLVDAAGIEAAVYKTLALEEAKIRTLSNAARAFYLRNDTEFRSGLFNKILSCARKS